VIDTTPVDGRLAAAIEAAEGRAWTDLYRAAPARFAQSAGVAVAEIDGTVVLEWAATGRRYFSRAIGLGVTAPASEERLDRILDDWERAGISMFLLQSLPHCAPAGYEGWLADRGLRPFDAQDRVIRGAEPLLQGAGNGNRQGDGGRGLRIERVAAQTADDWAEFIQRVYRLDTGDWLAELIGRPGWHQYIARQDGAIVAARGMHIDSAGFAWLGMDAPVPGVMSDDYESDAALCTHMVADGLKAGARLFLTDIEAPSDALDTPAYANFARLGFRRPYVRTHFARTA
jgi:hypothetical protein